MNKSSTGILIGILSLIATIVVAIFIKTNYQSNSGSGSQISNVKESTIIINQNNPKSPLKPQDNNLIPQNIEIDILSPSKYQKVPRIITIKGNSKNFSDKYYIWSYVYAPGESKYYFTKVYDIKNNGSWEIDNIHVGEEHDYGAKFEIGVMVTNRTWSNYIQKHKNKKFIEIPPGRKIKRIVQRNEKVKPIKKVLLNEKHTKNRNSTTTSKPTEPIKYGKDFIQNRNDGK